MWPLRVQKASRIEDSLRASIPHVYHTTGKACRCEHIAAVEHLLPISSEASLGKKLLCVIDISMLDALYSDLRADEILPRMMVSRSLAHRTHLQHTLSKPVTQLPKPAKTTL